MKAGDRELIACDAVAAYRSKMLRERARPLRESAGERDLTKLVAELQEVEIKKFQLDADNAEISDWNKQLTKCNIKLRTMRHLHRDGEPLPPDHLLTMPPCDVLHISMQPISTPNRTVSSCNTLWIISQLFIDTCASNPFG